MRTRTLLTIIAVEIAILIAVVLFVGSPVTPGATEAEIEAAAQTIEEERRDELEGMDPGNLLDIYLDDRSRAGVDGARADAAGEIDALLREFEREYDAGGSSGPDSGDR